MGKGSGGQTTTVQKADPWVGIQPALGQLYNGALSNFNGPGQQYFPGSTVADPSSNTQLAQQLGVQRALSGSPVMGAANSQAQQTLDGNYLWNGQASPGLTSFANQQGNTATNGLARLGAGGFNIPGQGNLQYLADHGINPADNGTLVQIGNGAMLNRNPFVDKMFGQASQQVGQQFSQNVMPGIASMFAGAGRYSSNQMGSQLGQAQQQYGNTLDNLATQIYGGNYQNERGLQQNALEQLNQQGIASGQAQLGAASQLGQQGFQGLGVQGNAFGQLGQFGTSALNTMSQAFAQERNNQMQAMGQSPNLANQDFTNIGALAGVGQAQDTQNQNQLTDQVNRFNFNQNIPFNQVTNLNAILNGGLGALSGATQTQSSQGNMLMQLLGGGLMGSSIFKNMGGAAGIGQLFSGIGGGAAAGGAAAGIGGIGGAGAADLLPLLAFA